MQNIFLTYLVAHGLDEFTAMVLIFGLKYIRDISLSTAALNAKLAILIDDHARQLDRHEKRLDSIQGVKGEPHVQP